LEELKEVFFLALRYLAHESIDQHSEAKLKKIKLGLKEIDLTYNF